MWEIISNNNNNQDEIINNILSNIENIYTIININNQNINNIKNTLIIKLNDIDLNINDLNNNINIEIEDKFKFIINNVNLLNDKIIKLDNELIFTKKIQLLTLTVSIISLILNIIIKKKYIK